MINTVYVIAGPTATGKSDLSISLAKKISGAVINSDSMQVYENLEILTARPTLSEMKNINIVRVGEDANNFDAPNIFKNYLNNKSKIDDKKS